MTGSLEGFEGRDRSVELRAVAHDTLSAFRGKAAGVYRITCMATLKSYIGSSTELHRRLPVHLSHLRNGKHNRAEMQADFNRYGERTFLFGLVAESKSAGEALNTEMALLESLRGSGALYNYSVPVPVVTPVARPDAKEKASLAARYSYSQIFDKWPSMRELANDIGVISEYARILRRRDSLPAMYWLRLVAAAKIRQIDGVTLEVLATIEAGKDGFLLEEAA